MVSINSLYLIAIPIILCAFLVITVRNPVHSVVALMAVFCFTTIFLITLGCDFIAFIFLMVYVGAIAVLFLFVVMMLNIRILDWSQYFYRYLPIGSFVGIILFIQIISYFDVADLSISNLSMPNMLSYSMSYFEIQLIEHFGISMYTIYAIPFISASIVLLVAMLGAIVLTLYRRFNLKKQSVVTQLRRNSVITLYR